MRLRGVLLTGGLLAGALGVAAAVQAATRLDRLHIRVDAAWRALDEALRQRARVVQELGVSAVTPPVSATAARVAGRRADGGARRVLADAQHAADPVRREEAENELSRVLAVADRSALTPVQAVRLADAEQRVVIARRMYNDAVRDTVALRSHRLVRLLRLAGTAALPRYFEIAEPALSEAEAPVGGDDGAQPAPAEGAFGAGA